MSSAQSPKQGTNGSLEDAISELRALDPLGAISYGKFAAIARKNRVGYWELYRAFQRVRGIGVSRKGSPTYCWLCVHYGRINPKLGRCEKKPNRQAKALGNRNHRCRLFMKNPRIRRR